MTIGKRMLPSLKGIFKSTGTAMFGIIKEAKRYNNPSLPSFDAPSYVCVATNNIIHSHLTLVQIWTLRRKKGWPLCESNCAPSGGAIHSSSARANSRTLRHMGPSQMRL